MLARAMEAAVRYFKQALAIYRELGDRHGEGRMLNGLGALARAQGRKEEAAGYYEQAVAIFEEIGEPDSWQVVHGHLEALRTLPSPSEANDSAPEPQEPALAPEPAPPVATASGKRRRWWRIGR